mgnify:CR=1 FL=1
MEALILTIDVVVMTYLCWRIVKSGGKTHANGGLGWLSYKKRDSE